MKPGVHPGIVRCVVCQAELSQLAERYANAWEKSRRRFPCCERCLPRFDPDVHWIPARHVDPPSPAERVRILQIFGKRLGGGGSPRVCVREALLAGIAPAVLREEVKNTAVFSARAQLAADRKAMRGILSWLFLGRGAAAESRDLRSTRTFQDALDDLDEWEPGDRADPDRD